MRRVCVSARPSGVRTVSTMLDVMVKRPLRKPYTIHNRVRVSSTRITSAPLVKSSSPMSRMHAKSAPSCVSASPGGAAALSLCHAFPLRKVHNFSGGIRGRGARVNHTKRGTACRAFCFYSLISSTRCSMAVCRFIYTTFRRPSLSLHMAGWHLFPGAAASSIRFFQVFPSSFE